MVADFTRTGEVRTFEKSRWNGKQRLTERYRYINQVRYATATMPAGELVRSHYHQCNKSLSTGMPGLHRTPLTKTMSCKSSPQPCRWKIENENNNVLKNHAIISTTTLPTASSICPTSWLRSTYWPSSPIRRLNGWTKLTVLSVVRPLQATFFENLRTLLQFIPLITGSILCSLC